MIVCEIDQIKAKRQEDQSPNRTIKDELLSSSTFNCYIAPGETEGWKKQKISWAYSSWGSLYAC